MKNKPKTFRCQKCGKMVTPGSGYTRHRLHAHGEAARVAEALRQRELPL